MVETQGHCNNLYPWSCYQPVLLSISFFECLLSISQWHTLLFWFVRVLTLVKLLSSGDDFEINSSKFQDNSKFFFFSRMCRRVVYLFLLEREKKVKTPYKAAIRCLEGRIRLQNKIQSGLIARNKNHHRP